MKTRASICRLSLALEALTVVRIAVLTSTLVAGCKGTTASGPAAPPTTVQPIECSSTRGSFVNRNFLPRTGRFIAEFDTQIFAAPHQGSAVGISQHAGKGYGDMAAILFFQPDGLFMVRNSKEYLADVKMAYAPSVLYHVRFDVDVPAGRYSAFVTPPGEKEVALAMNYAFRQSEKAGPTDPPRVYPDFENLRMVAGPGGKLLQVCNFKVSEVRATTSGPSGSASPSVAASDRVVADYPTYKTWKEVMAGVGAKYLTPVRISDPGTPASPAYTGFWWYLQEQFDVTGRYALGMKVYFQNREVRATDRADIGVIDLRDGNRWTKIGESTAWNWQQGNRLQWRPHSDEIIWNDRSDDGTRYITRVYNLKTGARRTLPRAIYSPSPDGRIAVTRDFERPGQPGKDNGTDYNGIPDPHAGRNAPAETGIWKVDLDTGSSQLIMSLQKMVSITGHTGYATFFKLLWNPSGSRFSTAGEGTAGWSMTPDGTDVRYLGNPPGHSAWHDDNVLMKSVNITLIRDDGMAKIFATLADNKPDSHPSYIPGQRQEWITADTYPIEGFQYLFLFHVPTRVYVPLLKLRNTAPGGIYRVDLQGRTTRDGRVLCFDSSYEGLGRQMYTIDIGHILNHPPRLQGKPETREAPSPLTPHAQPLVETFSGVTDFSDTQGYRHWTYLDSNGATLTFNPQKNRWQGSYLTGFPRIATKGYYHPSTNDVESVHRWTAPRAGEAKITGLVYDNDPRCGKDGVLASVVKNDTRLWKAIVHNTDKSHSRSHQLRRQSGVTFSLTTTVVQGDRIEFRTNALTEAWCDYTGFEPTIVLTSTSAAR